MVFVFFLFTVRFAFLDIRSFSFSWNTWTRKLSSGLTLTGCCRALFTRSTNTILLYVALRMLALLSCPLSSDVTVTDYSFPLPSPFSFTGSRKTITRGQTSSYLNSSFPVTVQSIPTLFGWRPIGLIGKSSILAREIAIGLVPTYRSWSCWKKNC